MRILQNSKVGRKKQSVLLKLKSWKSARSLRIWIVEQIQRKGRSNLILSQEYKDLRRRKHHSKSKRARKSNQVRLLQDCTRWTEHRRTELIRPRKTTSTKRLRKSVPSLRTSNQRYQLGKRQQFHKKRRKGNWRRSKSKWKDCRRPKKRKNVSITWWTVVFPSLRIRRPCSKSKSKKKMNYKKMMKVPRTTSSTNTTSRLQSPRFLALAKVQHRLQMWIEGSMRDLALLQRLLSPASLDKHHL